MKFDWEIFYYFFCLGMIGGICQVPYGLVVVVTMLLGMAIVIDQWER